MADVESGGISRPRVLFQSETVSWIGPYDWSADRKRLAVKGSRPKQPAQIGWLSVDDGSLHAGTSDPEGNSNQLLDASGSPYELRLIPVAGGQPTRFDLGIPGVTPHLSGPIPTVVD